MPSYKCWRLTTWIRRVKVSPMVSAFVAAPLTYAFFRQNVKLEESNKQLAIANQALGVETEIAQKRSDA